MKNLFRNKTFIIVAAVCVVFLAYLIFNIHQYASRDKYPVMFEYDQDSGVIMFQVQARYKLKQYKTVYTDKEQVEYDTTVDAIEFDVRQIQMNKSAYLIFYCCWADNKNEKSVLPCKYEIIRGDNETCIMHYNEFDNPNKSFSFPPIKDSSNINGQSLGEAQAQINKQYENNNEIIAKVNDSEITKKTFEVFKSNMSSTGEYSDEDLLNQLIEKKVLYFEAVAEGFSVSDDEINTHIAENKRVLAEDENLDELKFLQQYINGLGISEDEYWEEMATPVYREVFTINKLIQQLKDNYFKENASLDLESTYNSFSDYLTKYKKDLLAKANIQIFESVK